MTDENFIDSDIFIQASNGNKEAFEIIFEKYNSFVYSVAYRLSANEFDAKDLTQQVFLKLFLKIKTVKNVSFLYGWLKKTCINLYIDEFRKQNKIVLKENLHIELPSVDIYKAIGLLEDCLIDLDYFLGFLKKEERLVTWLFAVEGYKHKEIAKKLGTSLSNSKQLYRRSLKKLMQMSNEI